MIHVTRRQVRFETIRLEWFISRDLICTRFRFSALSISNPRASTGRRVLTVLEVTNFRYVVFEFHSLICQEIIKLTVVS